MTATVIDLATMRRALIANIERDIPTMIWGPPGVGKSKLVEQVAKELDYGLIDFRATLRDPVDLRGLPMIDPKLGTSRWLPPHELPQAGRDGPKGILFLDELPQAGDAMQKGCFSLVLDRYIGEYKLPKGWVPVAAGNRLLDRSGASRMNKALANRFAHFEVAAELDAWRAWADKVNLHPLVVAFVCFRPKFLHMMPEGDENTFPTPRAWEQVAKHADEQDQGLRHALVAGLVGQGPADEFEAFARVFSRLPSIDAILRDPKSVHVPDLQEPSLLYAVAAALSRRATQKNFGNAIIYAKRLPKEHEVAAVVGAIRRDPELKATKAFVEWYVGNQEILV